MATRVYLVSTPDLIIECDVLGMNDRFLDELAGSVPDRDTYPHFGYIRYLPDGRWEVCLRGRDQGITRIAASNRDLGQLLKRGDTLDAILATNASHLCALDAVCHACGIALETYHHPHPLSLSRAT